MFEPLASRLAVALITAGLAVFAVRVEAQEDQPDFSADQLEQLVAPIALYPDPLLTTVLIASTYPLEVVQADRWMKSNASLAGAELEKALAGQRWDDSVKSLAKAPDVLARMSTNLDWTSDLGDAFLGQQRDVLAAVQRMRKRAADEGNLKTTTEQTIVVQKQPAEQPAASGGQAPVVVEKEIITIVPSDPQVIYVPQYSAPAVYGSAWSYPTYYYPSMYAYPPGYVATASLVSFGVGMAVGAAVWGNCNWGGGWASCCGGWGGGDVDIDRNVNVGGDVNVGSGNRQQRWQHNPEHRRGVSYRNENVSRRYEGAAGQQRQRSREQARGYAREGGRAGDRQAGAQARGAGDRQRQAGAQARGGGDRQRQGGAQSVGAGDRGGGRQAGRGGYEGRGAGGGSAGAFGGGHGSFERAASQRGAASRGGYGSGSYGGSRSGGSRSYGGGGRSYGGGGRGGGRGRR